MIDLGSIAGLYAHEMHAYCSTCGRWSALDRERMVRDGHGERRLPIRARCQVCGEPGVMRGSGADAGIGWIPAIRGYGDACGGVPRPSVTRSASVVC